MLGIDQHDLITAFQQIENGTPIDARAFESHLFHMSLREPVVKLSEPIGRRCKGTDRFLDGPDRAGSAADILRRFSVAHPNHNRTQTRLAFALSFLSGTASACETESSSGAERGAGAKHTSSFTCSPASQGATLISSERTRISFERGFLDTIIQRSRLAALLDSTPFSC